MLIMLNPNVPNAAGEIPGTEEMKGVIGLYGRTYHLWQIHRGDTLPLGKPELMTSFTKDKQVPWGMVKDRDERYGWKRAGRRKVERGLRA